MKSNIAKKLLLILFVLAASVTISYGQTAKKKKEKKIELFGYVIDAKTKAGPDSVFVTLMRADSTIIDTMTCHKYEKNRWNMRDRTYYELKVSADSAVGKFIVKAKAPGYYPNTVDYEIKKVARNHWFELPMIYMRPMKVGVPDSIMLDEVVVKATKIKMVQRGDTIIYNADAFPLEEGSMLDALVKQLPGAQLSSEGEITVNGEKVEELTLNGKDFFKGNKKVMLENLPSFTVKNIQVYHKSSKKSEMYGRDVEKKAFTMDVQLKRQYNKGFLGNVEVAGGTEDRYMARLFALRYTDCSRLSVYANTNNVNENRKPGRDGDWDPANQPEGSRTTRKVGIDLNIEEKEQRWEESGNVEFSWDKSVDENTSNSEQYLTKGNSLSTNYSRSMSDRVSYSKRVALNNSFSLRKPFTMMSDTRLDYSENNSTYFSRSMLADEELNRWGNVQQSLDSAFSAALNPDLQMQLINRRLDKSKSNYKSFNANQNTIGLIKLASGDQLECQANASYSLSRNKNYSMQDVNYYRISNADLYMNQFNTSPSDSYNYRLRAGYFWNPTSDWYFIVSTGYYQEYIMEDHSYYNIHKIDGWGAGSIHPLGELPSNYEKDVLAIDAQNSYRSYQMEKDFDNQIQITYQKYNDSIRAMLMIVTPLSYKTMNFDYCGVSYNANVSQKYFYYNPTMWIYFDNMKKKFSLQLNSQFGPRKPSLLNLVDVRNDTDPLNVRLGNPDLKDSFFEDVSIYSSKRWDHGGDTLSVWTDLNAGINATQNAVSQGYTVDLTTGGRTYKPVNVDGNWSWNTKWGLGMDFGKEKRFNLYNSLGYNFSQSVDMAAVAGQTDSGLSKVHNNIWSDNISLTYRSGDSLSLGISGKVEYRNSTSDQTNFNEINATNFSYGFNGMWRVFRTGITLATDIKMFSRRGYASSDLNTDNLVWNASISRSFLKKKLTARLEMFDILHQLTNTNINVNAQGRYETVTNTLPRYAMLHLQWNFNTMKTPKK